MWYDYMYVLGGGMGVYVGQHAANEVNTYYGAGVIAVGITTILYFGYRIVHRWAGNKLIEEKDEY
jgi:hypothetical protein